MRITENRKVGLWWVFVLVFLGSLVVVCFVFLFFILGGGLVVCSFFSGGGGFVDFLSFFFFFSPNHIASENRLYKVSAG